MAQTTLYNPLDDFATYSVHYIMLACRTTEEAKVFTAQPDTIEGQRINADTLAAIEKVKYLGDPIAYGDNPDIAYLVMDTRRFSQFQVERLKYDALINGVQATGSQGNLVTTVEMTIVDAVGISFINFLTWMMNVKMQCNFDGMIYMLRVLFVGHHTDGSTETVQTITIPMHLFKMELNLDYGKGIYNVEFMPNMNFDAQRHSRWLNINSASSFFSGAGGNTLGGVIDNFEAALNKRSEEYFNDANKAVGDTRSTNKHGKFGRLVRYQISLPKEWRSYILQGWGTNAATETIFKKTLDDSETKKVKETKKDENTGKPIDVTVSVPIGTTITNVLNAVFKQVPEIAQLGNGRKTQGQGGSVSFYNFLVGTTSDENTVIVHVDVIPFVVPNAIIEQQKKANSVSADDSDFYEKPLADGARLPREFIEFDYIFTGKNKDILNFDLKLQDLQWMLASNLDMGAGVMGKKLEDGQKEGDIPVNPNSELITARPYDPLLLPKNTDAELKNFTQYSNLVLKSAEGQAIRSGHQDYLRNLSNFYAASPITCAITIRGNPLIMSKFSDSRFMPHIITATASSTGVSTVNTQFQEQYRTDLEAQIVRDNTTKTGTQLLQKDKTGALVVKSITDRHYANTPVFVKINIKGPNVDDKTGDMRSGDFARTILENNFYVVMKVTNVIEGGRFTQDLELFSHNIFGRGKTNGPPDKTIKNKT